jgi:hypothetical protein
MFNGLFGKKNVPAAADAVGEAQEIGGLEVEVQGAKTKTGRRGRGLSEVALLSHDAVALALTDTAMTRGKILDLVPEGELREYANGNWQNLIARLVRDGRAVVSADSHGRGRGVTYQKV